MPSIIPTIIERWNQGAAVGYDIYSRLLKDRIIFIGGYGGAIDTDSANVIIAQLLYLEAEDPEREINLYINSPGGMVTAGLAVYDTMQYIKAPITTICLGMAMSFGALLLGAGRKGKRYALPNSRIMIHQPSGGAQGQASDIEIQAREIIKTRGQLNRIYAERTGQALEKIEADMERDFFMSPDEAKAYGLIDQVIDKRA